MGRTSGRLFFAIAAALVFLLGNVSTGQADWNGQVSYQEDVYPIIHFRCLACHTTGQQGTEISGLNLETYEGLMRGTKFGPVVIPGNPLVSNLNVLVEGRAAIRMPHNQTRLTPCDVQILRRWVQQGARNN